MAKNTNIIITILMVVFFLIFSCASINDQKTENVIKREEVVNSNEEAQKGYLGIKFQAVTSKELLLRDLPMDLQGMLVIQNEIDNDNYYHRNVCLHIASLYENLNIFEYIIPIVPDINFPDYMGRTAFMKAIKWNYNFELIKLLLSKGADINEADNNGDTPFIKAFLTFNGGMIGVAQRLIAEII